MSIFHKRSGFTLSELSIVLVIIGLIAWYLMGRGRDVPTSNSQG